MDAPGGLEFDQDFEANEALYDFIEDQLHEGRDEMEDFVIVDDDGDQEFFVTDSGTAGPTSGESPLSLPNINALHALVGGVALTFVVREPRREGFNFTHYHH